MAGRGAVEAQDRTPHPRVIALNKDDQWVPAIDPLHFDKSAAGVGLGRTFGMQIADANPGITVGLIPCAVGGSPIDAWKPGEFYAPTRSHPWDDALRRAKLALKSGVLKGILWHQGESDANDRLAPAYEAKLHDLIKRLRAELDVPRSPSSPANWANSPTTPGTRRGSASTRPCGTCPPACRTRPASARKDSGTKATKFTSTLPRTVSWENATPRRTRSSPANQGPMTTPFELLTDGGLPLLYSADDMVAGRPVGHPCQGHSSRDFRSN